ncbi:MAG: Ppx/GppA family phosphatase [Pseudomonadota bacterium]
MKRVGALSDNARKERGRITAIAADAAGQGDLFADQLRSFHLPKPGDDRIGVVDVGSNSVRMVVFEDGRRCPAMVFNEKIMCGLGADLDETGKLDPEGCDRTMVALHRFVAMAPGLKVGALVGMATAAVREAKDGRAFRDRIENETGIRLRIASGKDEARYAALGVLFGDPAAEGLVLDLGGASMEFCPVANGKPGTGISTPLGPQRIEAPTPHAARRAMDAILSEVAPDFADTSQRLYLVGGAWRALGRVQIDRVNHPMNILHEYRFSAADALKTAEYILNAEKSELSGHGVPSARVASLPHAAVLLQAVIEHFDPKDLVISGFGLREGLCYRYLPAAIRRQDPLLSTCRGQERTRARDPGFGAELANWILAAFVPESPEEERLIRAACHLVDVSWRAHPDYRTTACLEAVTRVNVSSAGHKGRAFIGAALLGRYKGARRLVADIEEISLLSDRRLDRALQIGALMRLGSTISGAVSGYLPNCPLSVEDNTLFLKPIRSSRVLMGEEVEKRLLQAARALGLDWQIGSD